MFQSTRPVRAALPDTKYLIAIRAKKEFPISIGFWGKFEGLIVAFRSFSSLDVESQTPATPVAFEGCSAGSLSAMLQCGALGGALFIFFSVAVANSQSAIPLPHVQIPGASVPRAPAHPQQPPCYEVAGVSKAAIQERQNVARAANARVEAICANASLTPQQRAQEIRQIRVQQRAEMNAIVTPQQQEAINACNKARHRNLVANAPHPGPARGPCGELLPPAGVPTQHPQPVPGTQPGGTPQPTAQPQSSSDPQE